MPSKVNLTTVLGVPQTVAQADESLKHLSNVETINSPQQLYTGGVYNATASVTLNLPTDGNRFAIRVETGHTVTFSGGTVEGVNGATMAAGGLKHVWRDGGDWKVIDTGGVTPPTESGFKSRTLTFSGTTDADTTMYWMNSFLPTTLTIQAGLPDGHVFAVIRQNSVVTVSPTGGEVAIDPITGANDTSFTMNEKGGAWFKKSGNSWEVARMP